MEELNNEQKAFLAGFKASWEGWNWEWPFEWSSDQEIWDDIKENYKK